MNTGVQRSGATPPAARTATTEAGRRPSPGNVFGQGKSVPLIAMAHEIPYVATATVADLHDLEAKVERAMAFRGARYLHVLVPVPARLGHARRATRSGSRGSRTETGLFPVFEAEHGEVTGVSEDPPPGAGRGVPAAAAALTPTCSSPTPRTDVIARIQARADRNIAASACSTEATSRDGQAVRDHARRRLEPRQQDRLVAHRAARCTSTACRRATHACPAGENIQALALPRRGGRLRGRVARDHGRQPVARGHGPRLLPPVRDGLQPRPARRGGRHQLGRALPRRRGDQAGLALSTPTAAPTGKRVLVVGAGPSGLSAAYHLAPARPRRRRSATPGRRAGGMMRFGIPQLPAAARRARRRDRSASSTWASTLRARHARSTTSATTMREGGFDAAFLAVGAHLGKRAYIPAGSAAHIARRGLAAAQHGGRGARRCSAAASSSTAAATPRWTPPAPRKRLGAEEAIVVYRRTRDRMPAHDFEVEEALEEGVLIKWLSTIKHADGGRLRAREDGARRDRLPAADRRVRGARGRLARARARPGGRPRRCSTRVAGRRDRRRRRPGRRRT